MLPKPLTPETLARVQERFWQNVDRRGPDECWPWLGAKARAGYGRIKDGRRVLIASRVLLHLTGAGLGADEFACHRCDNPGCVNPAHLFVGTPRDNMLDMTAKGRGVQHAGALNPRAKLTPEQVRQIRLRTETHRALGAEFGVSASAIRDIKAGRNWSHIK